LTTAYSTIHNDEALFQSHVEDRGSRGGEMITIADRYITVNRSKVTGIDVISDQMVRLDPTADLFTSPESTFKGEGGFQWFQSLFKKWLEEDCRATAKTYGLEATRRIVRLQSFS